MKIIKVEIEIGAMAGPKINVVNCPHSSTSKGIHAALLKALTDVEVQFQPPIIDQLKELYVNLPKIRGKDARFIMNKYDLEQYAEEIKQSQFKNVITDSKNSFNGIEILVNETAEDIQLIEFGRTNVVYQIIPARIKATKERVNVIFETVAQLFWETSGAKRTFQAHELDLPMLRCDLSDENYQRAMDAK